MKGFQRIESEFTLPETLLASNIQYFFPKQVPITTFNPLENKPGKRQILKKFKNLKPVKSEGVIWKNLKVLLIRGHKRILRNLYTGKNPADYLNFLDENNDQQASMFKSLTDHFVGNLKVLKKLSKTFNGPITEGKTQRKRNEDLTEVPKSFNKTFWRQYFSTDCIITSFKLYVDYLFSSPISTLQKRFRFTCCHSQHDKSCEELWHQLKCLIANNIIP